MNPRIKNVSWRALGIALLGLSLVGAAAFSVSARPAPAQAGTSRIQTLKPAGAVHLTKTGFVDMSKLPVATGKAATTAKQIKTDLDRMTPSQRAAYNAAMRRGAIRTPQVKGVPAPTATKAAVPSPNFDVNGYSDLPDLVYGHAGLSQTQEATKWYPPDQAIASNPSYVMEGVNNLYAVYNFSGGLVSGPVTSDSFFSSLLGSSGDFLSDPQMFWDASRLHWIIVEIQVGTDGSGNTIDYYDVAVSKTQNVALNPATQYYLYQFGANVGLGGGYGNWCDYPTLGGDYWGLWFDCVAFSNNSFAGNVVFGFGKNAFYTGSGESGWYWTNIPAPNSAPAYRLSSASEDGTPDAEFLIATDAGYGPSNDTSFTTCAWTNTRALVTGSSPSASCIFNTNLPVGYNDPVGAAQPGTSVLLYPGYGTKMIEYKGGNLYFALTTSINSATSDGVLWAEVEPQLSALNPSSPGSQTVQSSIVRQANIFSYSNAYAFMGTLEGSSEDDAVLVLNYSGASFYPSIAYMGRRATDPLGAMAINGVTAAAIGGSNPNGSGRWGDYSGCSLDTNLTSRGLIWCGGEYGGPDASASGTAWDTWIYGMRVE